MRGHNKIEGAPFNFFSGALRRNLGADTDLKLTGTNSRRLQIRVGATLTKKFDSQTSTNWGFIYDLIIYNAKSSVLNFNEGWLFLMNTASIPDWTASDTSHTTANGTVDKA